MNRVFISYSHKDQDRVKNWLLKKLEQQGIATHIDYRDFDVGLASQINTERAIEKCAKTILVFTPNWLESAWTQFEGIMLQAQDPIGLKRRILSIMFIDCKLPPRLSILT